MPEDLFTHFYRGNSMYGTLYSGDHLMVMLVAVGEINAGDVIVFVSTHTLRENREVW